MESTSDKDYLKQQMTLFNENPTNENFINIMKVIEEQKNITMLTICTSSHDIDNETKNVLSSLFFGLRLGSCFCHSYEFLFLIWNKYYNLINKRITYNEFKQLSGIHQIILLRNNIDLFTDVLNHDIEYILLNLVTIVDQDHMMCAPYYEYLIKIYNILKNDINDNIANDALIMHNDNIDNIDNNSANNNRRNGSHQIVVKSSNNSGQINTIDKIKLFNQCLLTIFNKKYKTWTSDLRWVKLNDLINMSPQLMNYVLNLNNFTYVMVIDVFDCEYDFCVKMLNNNNFCKVLKRNMEDVQSHSHQTYRLNDTKWCAIDSDDPPLIIDLFEKFVLLNDLKKVTLLNSLINDQYKLSPVNIDPTKITINENYQKKSICCFNCNKKIEIANMKKSFFDLILKYKSNANKMYKCQDCSHYDLCGSCYNIFENTTNENIENMRKNLINFLSQHTDKNIDAINSVVNYLIDCGIYGNPIDDDNIDDTYKEIYSIINQFKTDEIFKDFKSKLTCILHPLKHRFVEFDFVNHKRFYTCTLLHVAAYYDNTELFNLVKNRSDSVDIEAFELTKFLIPMAPAYHQSNRKSQDSIDFSIEYHKGVNYNPIYAKGDDSILIPTTNTDCIFMQTFCNSVQHIEKANVANTDDKNSKKYELIVMSPPVGFWTSAGSLRTIVFPSDVELITFKPITVNKHKHKHNHNHNHNNDDDE